ncbi:tetratricopeptide repeat protein [Methanococcus voltae]|uniref:TPR repeat-containing protein n=1 Tax=Methanococcus voltae (strain ATCC BAA-1334 / A3) TaxID=456320 RepID=D7DS66_METV3|nr:tetratricopeptide repeat protein [Methanococcus voltae]MCS3901502.1 tetratricopeptide (TPR) repeat protein [Methanococcus voltae]
MSKRVSKKYGKLPYEINNLLKNHKYVEALDKLNKIEEFQNKNPDFYTNRGIVYSELKQYDNAINDFTTAIMLKNNDPKLYFNRGTLYKILKKYSEALKDYDMALSLNSKYTDVYLNRGIIYSELKKYDKAIDDFTTAISIRKDSKSYSNRGLIYTKLKMYNNAMEDFNNALNIDYTNTDAYENRGCLYGELKKYNNAMEDFQKADELKNDSNTKYNLGTLYKMLKKYDKALFYLNKALELDNKNVKALINRRNIYVELREYDKALKDNNYIINIQNNSKSYFERGTLHKIFKKYDKALKDYNIAINLDNNNYDAYINRGIVYSELKQYDNAMEDFNNAIKINPKNPMGYNNRSFIYLTLNNKTKAIEDLNRAVALDKNNYEVYLNRSIGYDKLDQIEKSNQDYNESKNIKYKKNMSRYINNYYLKNLKNLKITNELIESTISLAEKVNDFKNKQIKTININNKNSKNQSTNNNLIVHYTKPSTVKSLIVPEKDFEEEKNKGNNFTKSYLRLYNAKYMNDPEEGKLLVNELCKKQYKELFNKNNDGYSIQTTFIGSFLPDTDRLYLWRTYGKNDNDEEAGGLNIVFKENFFDNELDPQLEPMKLMDKSLDELNTSFVNSQSYDNINKSKNPLELTHFEKERKIYYNLYDVSYISKKELNDCLSRDFKDHQNRQNELKTIIDNLKKYEKYKDIKRYIKELEKLRELEEFTYQIDIELKKIYKIYEELTSKIEKERVTDMIISILNDVSYLIKSSDYKEEREMRVLVTLPTDDESIQFHVLKEFNEYEEFPERMYIDIEKSLNDENNKYDKYIEKVTMGPKLVNKNRWEIYLNRKGVTVNDSLINYR